MKLQTTFLVIAVVTSGLGSLTWGAEYGDYKAIEAAVKAGKLTKEEAASKLEYLKNAAAAKSQKKASPKSRKLTDYKAIEAAVKAGKLTKEEAASKLEYLKNAAATKSQKKASPKSGKLTDYKAVEARLSELVKSGLLSEEQAKAMMAAARKVR
jgi:polyhydroxyalkanoate synthesis regulator phasin